jgi:hypothetical protein
VKELDDYRNSHSPKAAKYRSPKDPHDL